MVKKSEKIAKLSCAELRYKYGYIVGIPMRFARQGVCVMLCNSPPPPPTWWTGGAMRYKGLCVFRGMRYEGVY
jgi:hypothetical protein